MVAAAMKRGHDISTSRLIAALPGQPSGNLVPADENSALKATTTSARSCSKTTRMSCSIVCCATSWRTKS
ncbi:hypothetical protein BJY04DRAFT_199725 [Aspergillus karnatakaensis]|uniref:uncharacterized protein n=1 Tax=Aspergillus karnatakaensis TaxID=1810916 RepID=UPI003CCD67C6